jgi:copper chaperone CopZ
MEERNTYQTLKWAQNMGLHGNGTDLQVEDMSTIQCHKQVKAILHNIKPSKHTSVLFITYLFLTPTCFNHSQSSPARSVIYTKTHVRLVCKTNFTRSKCILHTLSVLQHVLAHYTCHQQAVLVVVIIKLSNGWLPVTFHDKPDDGRCGVSKHVGELITYEEYI